MGLVIWVHSSVLYCEWPLLWGGRAGGRYKLLSFISRNNRSSMNNKAEHRPLSHCVIEQEQSWKPEILKFWNTCTLPLAYAKPHTHTQTYTYALARTIEAEVRIVSAFNKSRCSLRRCNKVLHMLGHNNKACRLPILWIGSRRPGRAINCIKLHLNVSDRLTMRGVSAIIDCKLNLTPAKALKGSSLTVESLNCP